MSTYATMPVSESKGEEPTAVLQWKGQTLQQAWRITTYQSGVPVKVGHEWRDVPNAQS